MADTSVSITPGAGANIGVNLVGSISYQRVKLDLGGDGVSIPLVGTLANGLPVDVTRVQGNVTIVPAASQNFPVTNAPATTLAVSATAALPVSALVAAPVFVRLSDGAAAITTLPVSGTVAVNQGTAALVGNAWPVEITDGVHALHLTSFSGAYAADVNVVGTVGVGNIVDLAAFTGGATSIETVGGVYNDAIATPTAGQAAAFRITQNRGVHINLRRADGIEVGLAAVPLQVQIGNGSVALHLTTVSGNPAADVNLVQSTTMPMTIEPRTGAWTQDAAFTASQTAINLRTPTTGKKHLFLGATITITGSGSLVIFDGTNTATSRLYSGTPPVGAVITISFDTPIPSSAINTSVLYTTGSGAIGNINLWGYEA